MEALNQMSLQAQIHETTEKEAEFWQACISCLPVTMGKKKEQNG